jgi:rhodanese-related sulfurtransferase
MLARASTETKDKSPMPASSTSHPSSMTCPLDLARAALREQPATLRVIEDKTCLINVREMKSSGVAIYDLRDRSEFIEFHIPGASSASVAALTTMPTAGGSVVVYDSGKFASDAFQLCDRLRRAGVKNFRILDGGIAAWAQWQHQPEKLLVSRLSDQEISAALLEPNNAVLGLTPTLQAAIKDNHLGPRKPDARSTGRTVILADESLPIAKIDALLDGTRRQGNVLYWLGSKERLKSLLNTYIAQDKKRLSGPAESSRCAAL